MSQLYTRTIPLGITFVTAMIMVGEYFLQVPGLKEASSELQSWGTILAAFALGLGTISMILRHQRVVRSMKSGEWYFSAWQILVAMLFVGIGLGLSQSHWTYQWLFDSIYVPVTQTIYGVIAFYVVTSAYRVFRARNLEASIVLVIAVLVIIGFAPVGPVIWEGFETIRAYIMNVASEAIQRGLLLAIAVGGVLLGVRMLLGYEKGFMGA